MAKKAYFIGIAGKTMGPLAKAFKDLGWEVSGSDHKGIYPPISAYLLENHISYIEGYDAKNVPEEADLVIVGRSATMVDAANPELARAKELGLSIMSFPEVFRQYLVKENSIVVAGSYGKTTTTAILAWILACARKNPSFMVSDIPLNFPDGTKITDSDFSVIEGDETPALEGNFLPKFMYYKPKYLVLTATKWDHPEVYKSQEAYLEAFKKLVESLPSTGFLVYEKENVDRGVVAAASCRKISYSLTDTTADYFVKSCSSKEGITSFRVRDLDLETILVGKHNLENLCGAVALSLELGLEPEIIREGVRTFKGVKSRLELLGIYGGRFIYADIAQFYEKVKGSLTALRDAFPDRKIICVFDPFATALKYQKSLDWYPNTFDKADQVVVGKVGFLKEITKEDRVTGKSIVEAISKTQKNVFYEPIDERIIDYLRQNTQEEDVIVFMSSGGLRFSNLIQNTIKKLKE